MGTGDSFLFSHLQYTQYTCPSFLFTPVFCLYDPFWISFLMIFFVITKLHIRRTVEKQILTLNENVSALQNQ